jgi:hypothetical protein
MNITTVVTAALGCSIVAATSLSAQTIDSSAAPAKQARWELVVPSGAMIPTGAQRDAVKRGNMNAVQITYVAQPSLAIVSTFGWARSKDVATAGSPKLDVFTYDIGGELRAPRWIATETMFLSPFAGLGAGGRSYNYRKLDVDATNNLAAYASAGAEVGMHRLRLRLEARDYVAGFKPLAGAGTSRTGNDVVVMVGLRVVSR